MATGHCTWGHQIIVNVLSLRAGQVVVCYHVCYWAAWRYLVMRKISPHFKFTTQSRDRSLVVMMMSCSQHPPTPGAFEKRPPAPEKEKQKMMKLVRKPGRPFAGARFSQRGVKGLISGTSLG